MARPKSDEQNAKHEEDAMRVKATTESRQIDMNRPENIGSKEAIDPNPVPASEPERAQAARQAMARDFQAKSTDRRTQQLDPNLGVNQVLNPELAAQVGPGSPVARTDRTQQSKIDEDRSVPPQNEAAEHQHRKAEPDQKPTAESNLSDHLRNAMPEPPKGTIPVDKRMHISDDLAMELSNKFAHHEIRYTNSGIDVLAGGEFISIDRNRLGKLETRADLRAYIDTLPVMRHG